MADMSSPALNCPHCKTPLHSQQVWPSLIHGCGRCGGVWLDAHACMRLVRSADPKILELAKRAASNAVNPVSGAEPRGCPVCNATMAHSVVKDVTLDACAQHGTWFDATELGRVAAKPRSPGRRPSGQVSEAELAEFRSALKAPSDGGLPAIDLSDEDTQDTILTLASLAFQIGCALGGLGADD